MRTRHVARMIAVALVVVACGEDQRVGSGVATSPPTTPPEVTSLPSTVPTQIGSTLDRMVEWVPDQWGLTIEPIASSADPKLAVDQVLFEYAYLTGITVRRSTLVRAKPTTEGGAAIVGGSEPIDAWLIELYGFADPIVAPNGKDTGDRSDVALALVDAESYTILTVAFMASELAATTMG